MTSNLFLIFLGKISDGLFKLVTNPWGLLFVLIVLLISGIGIGYGWSYAFGVLFILIVLIVFIYSKFGVTKRSDS